MYIIVIAYIPDCSQGVLQGVIRALNVQKQASYAAIAAYYLLSVPLACLLVFKVGMDVRGLWIGMSLGTLVQAAFYARLVLFTDWQQVADEAKERIANDNAALLPPETTSKNELDQVSYS